MTPAQRKRLAMLNTSDLERVLLLMEPTEKGTSLEGPTSAARALEPMLLAHEREHMAALFLDRRNRVISAEIMTIGSHEFTIMDPRYILRRALHVNASGLILGHNHPSGAPTPSQDDIRVTERMISACKAVGIPLIDHIVIGGPGCFASMADRGLIGAHTPYPAVVGA